MTATLFIIAFFYIGPVCIFHALHDAEQRAR